MEAQEGLDQAQGGGGSEERTSRSKGGIGAALPHDLFFRSGVLPSDSQSPFSYCFQT